MKTAYGVVWRENGDEQAGWLSVTGDGLRFTAYADEEAVAHELAFDEVTAVELRFRAGETTKLSVVVSVQDGREVEIASAVDRWITHDLLTQMLVHGLGGEQSRRQILVSVKLKPGCRSVAQELLDAGPPFDPTDTALTLHEVYLLADEALFLFETRCDRVSQVADIDFWRAATAWRELTTGEVHLAEPAYMWTRPESRPEREPHPGLGF